MKRFIVLIFLFAVTAVGGAKAGSDHLHMKTTEGSFEDVKLFVEDAVVNQGLVIDYKGRIGEMLKRTGSDVGSGKEIYKNAEFLLFCSAIISRATMEADATNISFCPYIIFMYELESEPEKIHVGFRRPAIVGSEASKKSLIAVDKLLTAIVNEATE